MDFVLRAGGRGQAGYQRDDGHEDADNRPRDASTLITADQAQLHAAQTLVGLPGLPARQLAADQTPKQHR